MPPAAAMSVAATIASAVAAIATVAITVATVAITVATVAITVAAVTIAVTAISVVRAVSIPVAVMVMMPSVRCLEGHELKNNHYDCRNPTRHLYSIHLQTFICLHYLHS